MVNLSGRGARLERSHLDRIVFLVALTYVLVGAPASALTYYEVVIGDIAVALLLAFAGSLLVVLVFPSEPGSKERPPRHVLQLWIVLGLIVSSAVVLTVQALFLVLGFQ